MWVLGIELVSSGRGASALNHWDISLASRKGLFWLMISRIDFTLIGKTWQEQESGWPHFHPRTRRTEGEGDGGREKRVKEGDDG